MGFCFMFRAESLEGFADALLMTGAVNIVFI
jgi:hypothetical protein